jgi:hypothetical protein
MARLEIIFLSPAWLSNTPQFGKIAIANQSLNKDEVMSGVNTPYLPRLQTAIALK